MITNGIKKRINTFIKTVFAIVLASLFFSCSTSYTDVDLVDAELVSLKMVGLTSVKVDIRAVIDNPNNISFKVQDVHGILYNKESQFALFSSDDVVEILKNSRETYEVSVIANVTDPLLALELIGDTEKIDMNDFSIDIEGKVKKAGVTIPVKKSKVPLSKLLRKGFK